jgi:hypothetical protein
MYYKLPIKERMELMKSYRKANPDMSYRDMVNDYNTSYEKFYNGGIKEEPFFKKESDKIVAKEKMLKSLKPTDFKTQKANYEEATRGANQMDGSGRSSAEMAYRAAKLADPTFVSNVAEVIKDAYMGNEQNGLNIFGAIPVPYVKGMGKIAKAARKWYYYDKAGDLTNKGLDIVQEYIQEYKYGGVQRFGDGGKKEVEPYKPKSQADYNYRKQMYNDSLTLGTYTDIQKKLEPAGISVDFKNPINRSQGVLQNYAAKIIKENPRITYQMEDGFPYKGEYGKLPEKVGEYNPNLASPDLYHPLIKPTGTWQGAAQNDTYIKPVQKILPFKKDTPINTFTKTNNVVKSKPKIIKKEEIKPENSPVEVPPIIPPVINPQSIKKDTIQYIPKQQVPSSDTLRHWDFNGTNPALNYYDKSGKLIKTEYYRNMNDFKQGKQIKQ